MREGQVGSSRLGGLARGSEYALAEFVEELTEQRATNSKVRADGIDIGGAMAGVLVEKKKW